MLRQPEATRTRIPLSLQDHTVAYVIAPILRRSVLKHTSALHNILFHWRALSSRTLAPRALTPNWHFPSVDRRWLVGQYTTLNQVF